MTTNRNSWTDKDIQMANWSKNSQLKNLRTKLNNYDNDNQKQTRDTCRCCYYINCDRAAFQAFTTVNCRNCGKEMVFPTSHTDRLCPECANELNLCKHCGSSMD